MEEGVYPVKLYSDHELPWWSVVVMDGLCQQMALEVHRRNTNF